MRRRLVWGAVLALSGGASPSLEARDPAPIPAASEELLQERAQLVNQFRKRSLGLKDLTEVEETRNAVSVTLFVNRFFLPNSAVLQEDGLQVLNELCAQLKSRAGKRLLLRTVFKAPAEVEGEGAEYLESFTSRRSAGARFVRLEESVPDELIIRRSLLLFSYLISGTMRPSDLPPS